MYRSLARHGLAAGFLAAVLLSAGCTDSQAPPNFYAASASRAPIARESVVVLTADMIVRCFRMIHYPLRQGVHPLIVRSHETFSSTGRHNLIVTRRVD